MVKHNELGKKGEEIAERHLLSRGFKVLEKNWRYGRDEIDIVATIDHWLVIVEVKTRTSDLFGEPETAVTPGKQRSIIRAAEGYIIAKDYKGETRFDVIGILFDHGKIRLNHIEDAFLPRLK
jgi:putative endonuclease